MEGIEVNPFELGHPRFSLAQRLLDCGLTARAVVKLLEAIDEYPDVACLLHAATGEGSGGEERTLP